MGTQTDPTRYRVRPGSITEATDVDLDEIDIVIDGKRYTEADAGLIENRHRGLVPGGKSLSGGKILSPVLRPVVPEDTFNKVKAAAEEQGMSVSKWLRKFITDKAA